MQTSLIINKIEKKYPVEKIKVRSISAWQFLRNIYADELNNKQVNSGLIKKKRRIEKYISSISNYYWGIENWQKHFSAVLFTDSLEERQIDGLKCDKLAHNIFKIMGGKILTVLDPMGKKHNQVSDYFHPHYLSIYKFVLPAKIKFKKYKIENTELLLEIESDLEIQIPFQKRVNQFFHYFDVFESWIKKTKPEVIFINCYFTLRHQALIYAAKQNGVITVELQHGIISKAQTPYWIETKIGRQSFPDYLLSFGEIEKKMVSENFIYSEKIIPIGNFYLEHMMGENDDQATNQLLFTLRKKYKKLLLVSLQGLVELQIVEFICQAAVELPEIAFILAPRKGSGLINLPPLAANILFRPEIDIYQFCSHCDYHSTMFSTFASESIYLGTPNIFININGLAKSYYSDIFLDNLAVKFADDVKSYVEIIKDWQPPEKIEIKKKIGGLFANENQKKIKLFLESHINS